MIGVVYKYNDELVFCPDLVCDFRLGKPNEEWIREEGGKILNIKDFPDLKECTEVEITPIYRRIYDEYNRFAPFWFGCNIIEVKQLLFR